MVAEKQINEFISRLREASGENLQSVILYGSAADGEFHPEFSNINLLCLLRESSFATLTALAPAFEWWTRQKQHAPLVLTRDELERSTDVFLHRASRHATTPSCPIRRRRPQRASHSHAFASRSTGI